MIFFILLVGCFSDTHETQKELDENETDIGTSENTEDYIGKQEDSISSEIQLTEQTINDLFILGKVWGFLKYYHPNVASGQFNWDDELLSVLPKIVDAKTEKERDALLVQWVNKLGTFEASEGESEQTNKIVVAPDLDWLTESGLSDELVEVLTEVKNGERTGEHRYVELDEHVGNPVFKNENPYADMSLMLDVEYRLLSLYRYWNMIEYFFPYKYITDDEWKDVLHEFIPKFIEADDELQYKLVTLELIAKIDDTHAFTQQTATLDRYWGLNHGPLMITFIEEKAVVTGYYDESLGEKTGLHIGDIITHVNSKSIEQLIEENRKYIPASNYPTLLRDIAPKLLRTNDDTLTIEYVRDGNSFTTEIDVYPSSRLGINSFNRFQDGTEPFQMIDSDIAYIYAGSMSISYLEEVLPTITGTKGLIVDLRSYPLEFIIYTLGEFLVPKETEFVKFSNGSIETPGLFTMTEPFTVGKHNKDYYKGKVVILINEYTQSQAEFTAMAFRTAPRATIIGSTTAGADGNVSNLILPGSINTTITGIGVYYPDGTQTQRVGIIPDIEVKPTIEGVKQGRDEILETAIDIINTDD